jgi:hypothetical protein
MNPLLYPIALFGLSSSIMFSGCDGYLAGSISSISRNYGFVQPNGLYSPIALTSFKTKTKIREPTRARNAVSNAKRSSLSIRMSENDDNGDDESFFQKAKNVMSTPITMPLPAFIASYLFGGLTISAGIFYSVYLMITVPDVTASVQTIVPESTSASTITKDELSEGQRDSIIFNEILSGIET